MADKDSKPKVTVKPATTATTKPATTVKPTTAKTTVTVKPATTAKTTTTVKPVATAKPTATAKATVTAKPVATAKATVTVKPVATAKTTVTVKPVATAKTTATAKPATTATTKPAKPATASVKEQPVKTAEPVKEVKSVKEEKAEVKAEKPAKAEKVEKPVKGKKVKEAKTGKGSQRKVPGWVAAINAKLDWRFIGLVAGISIFITACMLGLIFGLRSCKPTLDNPFEDFGELTITSISNSHKNKTQVGYSGEIVGVAERYKPVAGVHDEGFNNGVYPTYGSTLNLTTEQQTALIVENRKLTANGTWVDSSHRTTGSYDKMDKDGYLYKSDGSKPGNGVPERLYKHTASVGLYGGNVSDDEPSAIKNLTYRPRTYTCYYNVTGLYAPAGEVIKVQMSNADMKATGGITIHIGQALYNGQANNIWEGRGFNRMPVILNTMSVTEQTATYDEGTGLWTGYVGSFLGGPIYIRSETSTFSVTISGGVNYAHFILGVTTEEEYAVYAQSSAPYFDLEVWDRGVLHSGSKRYAQRFSYNDLYKVAILWEKISLVTTSVSNQGIVFVYDPFVAAGAAVAFPGRCSVNCPSDWMTSSLNYEDFVTSGSWGNLHEYHHNFQDYGVGYTGEVTNNGLNLVSYSLFTKVSALRQLADYGGAGLSGWNQYTSATWALNRVNNNVINDTNGLAVYATLLHNYGQDAFIKTRGAWGSNYYDKWANYTHQDMTYYASAVSSYGGGYTPSQAVQDANYPLFVPVSSVYQTGRTYNYDGEKREITTMQPYVIPYGQSFKVDLNPYIVNGAGQYQSGSIVIGNGFTYKIKKVDSSEVKGTFSKTGENIYNFTPNSELLSGKIYVTLEIYYGEAENGVREYNGHRLDDVDLILEFQQSHETKKNVLERTIYTYTADNMYADAEEAFNGNFANSEAVRSLDHSNPTQNCNTDIWYWTTTSGHEAYVETHPEYFARNNDVEVIDGKLFFREDGKYRIYLRGRLNCAVYFSLDNKDYTVGATIKDKTIPSNSAQFRLNDRNTYFDVAFADGKCTVTVYTGVNDEAGKNYEFTYQGDRWLFVKEVLIVQNLNMASYIGLGMGQWTTPMYNPKLDADGNPVLDDDGKPVYVDASGNEVSAEEASDTTLKAPTSVNYVTAYRQSYEFQKEFESDYFYSRTYGYDYQDNVCVPKNEVTVTETNYTATGWGAGMPITNISDGNTGTYIHTSWQVEGSSPLNLTFDVGGERTINRITFYCRNNNGMLETPKAFTVEGSLDGETWFDVAEYTDAPRNGNRVTVDFDDTTLSYLRIKITQTHQGKYFIVIGEIEMWHINEINGATKYSPDDGKFTYKGTWKIAQANSSYGHVYLGNSGSEVSFDYDAGNDSGRVGILTSNKYGQNFEVYVDGKKVDTVELKNDSNETALRYLTPVLSNGKHKVVIKCVGEANIDSIVFY